MSSIETEGEDMADRIITQILSKAQIPTNSNSNKFIQNLLQSVKHYFCTISFCSVYPLIKQIIFEFNIIFLQVWIACFQIQSAVEMFEKFKDWLIQQNITGITLPNITQTLLHPNYPLPLQKQCLTTTQILLQKMDLFEEVQKFHIVQYALISQRNIELTYAITKRLQYPAQIQVVINKLITFKVPYHFVYFISFCYSHEQYTLIYELWNAMCRNDDSGLWPLYRYYHLGNLISYTLFKLSSLFGQINLKFINFTTDILKKGLHHRMNQDMSLVMFQIASYLLATCKKIGEEDKEQRVECIGISMFTSLKLSQRCSCELKNRINQRIVPVIRSLKKLISTTPQKDNNNLFIINRTSQNKLKLRGIRLTSVNSKQRAPKMRKYIYQLCYRVRRPVRNHILSKFQKFISNKEQEYVHMIDHTQELRNKQLVAANINFL